MRVLDLQPDDLFLFFVQDAIEITFFPTDSELFGDEPMNMARKLADDGLAFIVIEPCRLFLQGRNETSEMAEKVVVGEGGQPVSSCVFEDRRNHIISFSIRSVATDSAEQAE